jgi:stage III sporulation protein AC
MDISLIFKIAGLGMLVAVSCQVLSKVGREDQASFVSVAGIIVALLLLVEEIGYLFEAVREVFGL